MAPCSSLALKYTRQASKTSKAVRWHTQALTMTQHFPAYGGLVWGFFLLFGWFWVRFLVWGFFLFGFFSFWVCLGFFWRGGRGRNISLGFPLLLLPSHITFPNAQPKLQNRGESISTKCQKGMGTNTFRKFKPPKLL